MIELIIPKEFPTHGHGYGRTKDRDYLKAKEREILRARQHNKCALCEKQLLSTQRIEVCHIIAKTKGGQLYDVSPNFPDALFPQACLGHKACNLAMGWELGLWQAQVAEYYGFKLVGIDPKKTEQKAREEWHKNNNRPKFYPFWLFKKDGMPIFLTDGDFDEQDYFRRQMLNYEPLVEQKNGALKPVGLGKSRF